MHAAATREKVRMFGMFGSTAVEEAGQHDEEVFDCYSAIAIEVGGAIRAATKLGENQQNIGNGDVAITVEIVWTYWIAVRQLCHPVSVL